MYRQSSYNENHPSETKDAEAKRAGNRASAVVGKPHWQPGDAL
jgi:hypothetical protein